MSTSTTLTTTSAGDDEWDDALRAEAAFLAGFRSSDTRKGYRRDLQCWLEFCAADELHPCVGVRRTHVEVYLRHLEQQVPVLADSTLRRRISTLSSWFTWLEERRSTSATRRSRPSAAAAYPSAAMAGPQRADDLLAAAEDEGGYPYALVCLLRTASSGSVWS